MNEFYVYKYVDTKTNDVFYIGQSICLDNRIKDHADEAKFKPYSSHQKIYFAKMENKEEMDFMEAYLISKYKPVLNTVFVGHPFSVSVDEPDWTGYDEWVKSVDDDRRKSLEQTARNSQSIMVDILKKQIEEYKDNYDGLKEALSFIFSLISTCIPGIRQFEDKEIKKEEMFELYNRVSDCKCVDIVINKEMEEKYPEIKNEIINSLFMINGQHVCIIENRKDDYNVIHVDPSFLPYLKYLAAVNFKDETEKIEEKIKEKENLLNKIS